MSREKTVNALPMAEASKKDWYLSVKPASPRQTLTAAFDDGKSYQYLEQGKVNPGDPVVIDFGGATSYRMGRVTEAVNGITIKRTHALKPLFTFSTDPQKAEIKKNSDGLNKLEEVSDASGYFKLSPSSSTEGQFRVVDFLVIGVLNAITVIAHADLATPGMLKEAKEYLAEAKPVPGIVFGREFTDAYYGVWFDILRYAESAEVILTGHYPGWDSDLLGCGFWQSEEYRKLRIQSEWNDDHTGYFLYFKDGSKPRQKFFSQCEEFKTITNELVMRSALSILIRGGFTNLLKAALTVEMPIKGFYRKLIAFADEIGSTECSKLLKDIDYENLTFARPEPEKSKPKADKSKPKADKSFKIKDDTLEEYKGKATEVVIPDGVKIIGEYAFSENQQIRKVVIPDSVTQIKKGAFSFCPALEEVVFGKNVSALGVDCFYECERLAAVDLSCTKVKTLNNSTFGFCAGLKSLDLSKTKIKSIKKEVFLHSGLKRILLPQTLESIGSMAFLRTEVEEIVIPASVKEIDSEAFTGYSSGGSALRRIVFEGEDPIDFRVGSVDRECVIVCKKGSELMVMLEKQNARQAEDAERCPHSGYGPRKLETQ